MLHRHACLRAEAGVDCASCVVIGQATTLCTAPATALGSHNGCKTSSAKQCCGVLWNLLLDNQQVEIAACCWYCCSSGDFLPRCAVQCRTLTPSHRLPSTQKCWLLQRPTCLRTLSGIWLERSIRQSVASKCWLWQLREGRGRGEAWNTACHKVLPYDGQLLAVKTCPQDLVPDL